MSHTKRPVALYCKHSESVADAAKYSIAKTGETDKMISKCLLIILMSSSRTLADEADLPICPTNIQYFPQNLPMHCRMPRSAAYPSSAEMQQNPTAPPPFPPPFPPSIFQSPPSDQQPNPVPIPIPGGLPMPPGFPMPGGMGPPGLPGIPGPLPMPLPMPGPAHKLPVIVMPFYSPDPSFKKGPKKPIKKKIRIKKRKKPRYDTDSSTDTESSDTSGDTSSDTSSSSDSGWWSGRRSGRRSNARRNHRRMMRRKHNKKELFTPVLQYVTKDGYVIFEKKISNNEAKDWLNVNKDADENKTPAENVENIVRDYPELDENIPDDVEMIKREKNKSVEQMEVKTQKTPVKKHRHHKSQSGRRKSTENTPNANVV